MNTFVGDCSNLNCRRKTTGPSATQTFIVFIHLYRCYGSQDSEGKVEKTYILTSPNAQKDT
jgi:hypothetical protein